MTHEDSTLGESGPLSERAAQVLREQVAAQLAPGLYVVATPIGNLADITLRALSTLARADVIYCEDTRHSRTLLAHYAITRPLKPYHEHNAKAERPRVLAELAAGRAVALISDAGTPLVSDPGYKLVREAADAGHAVTCIPGASALTTALAVAGLPTDTVLFAGFLPSRSAARRTRVADLKAIPATLVFFEAPSRLAGCLADLAQVLGPREAAVARELTKLHEEARRGALADLASWAAQTEPRGEMVILVAPGSEQALTDAEVEARLRSLLEDMSVRDAAKAAADTLCIPKARAYDLALALKRARDG